MKKAQKSIIKIVPWSQLSLPDVKQSCLIFLLGDGVTMETAFATIFCPTALLSYFTKIFGYNLANLSLFLSLCDDFADCAKGC